jgi:hypothetical protein
VCDQGTSKNEEAKARYRAVENTNTRKQTNKQTNEQRNEQKSNRSNRRKVNEKEVTRSAQEKNAKPIKYLA